MMKSKAVTSAIRSRANRINFLPPYLFADPAWDMLLDLYSSAFAEHRVSVTSLCVASRVPATTALRWMRVLENEGLINRMGDPLDARRYFIALTDAGLTAMDRFFASETLALDMQIAA